MITDKALDYLVTGNIKLKGSELLHKNKIKCQYRELIINYNSSFNLHSLFIFTLNELNVAWIVNTNEHNNYMNKGSVES